MYYMCLTKCYDDFWLTERSMLPNMVLPMDSRCDT